jgi:AraC-like DNA-binding protein
MKKGLIYENLKNSQDAFKIQKFVNHNSQGREHWHENIEILYFVSGSASTYCNGVEYNVSAGDILFVNANEFHIGTLFLSKSEFYCIQINSNFLSNFIGGKYVIFNNHITDSKCAEILDFIIKNYKKSDFEVELEIKKRLYSFFCILASKYVKTVLSKDDFKKNLKKHDKISAIINYINNYYNKPELSVSHIASSFSLSTSYLTHFFKDEYGKNISEYIGETRIRHAKTLLETTDMPIGEIAFNCGFLDANFFSRKFKQITGCTPTQYKNRTE